MEPETFSRCIRVARERGRDAALDEAVEVVRAVVKDPELRHALEQGLISLYSQAHRESTRSF